MRYGAYPRRCIFIPFWVGNKGRTLANSDRRRSGLALRTSESGGNPLFVQPFWNWPC